MLKKILKVTAFVIVVLITLIALLVVEENVRGKAAWERHLRELAAKGESLDILKHAPPPVPDALNLAAAPLFAELMTATNQDQTRLALTTKKLLPSSLTLGDWRLGQRTDLTKMRVALSNEDVLAALAPAAAVLKEIEEAAASRPQCRFPIKYEQGIACLLPHLGALRYATRALQVRALAELQAGQSAAACQDVQLIFRLTQALENEPMLISLLVRIAMQQMALQPIWEGLADHRWSADQLQRLQHDLAAVNLLPQLSAAFGTERCMSKWMLEKLLTNPKMINDLGGSTGTTVSFAPTGFLYFNCLNVDLFYQRYMLGCVDSRAGRIFPARADVVEPACDDVRRHAIPYHVLECLLIPAVSSVIIKSGVAETAVQSATVACALESYRLAMGRYPDKIEALVPQYLVTLPRDVIDGQPLRYRRDGDGFILYSIGWNQKDDGGQVVLQKTTEPTAKPRLEEKQGDWVWCSRPAP